jgi:hypothetical protein
VEVGFCEKFELAHHFLLIMGSFSGTCEIVEAREDLSRGKGVVGICQSNSRCKTSEKNKKPLVLNMGYKDYIDDDINKLFESFALKSSSRDLGISQDGTSHKLKNTLKKPMTMGVPRSPRVGLSESANLKQALRDLCISKASEVAAMKRLSKSTASPRISEVGRIQTLYSSVVDETCHSGPDVPESKGHRKEISLVPGKGKLPSLDKTSQSHQTMQITSSSQAINSAWETAVTTTQLDSGTSSVQSDSACSSSKIGFQSQHVVPVQPAKQTSASYQSLYNASESKLELPVHASSPKKLGNKVVVSNTGRKGRLQTASSSSTSGSGTRVNKQPHHAPHTVKMVIKNKSLSKKKVKEDSGSASCDPTSNEVSKSVPGPARLICERCKCALENTGEEKNKEIMIADSTSPGNGANSSDVHSGSNKPGLASTSGNINKGGKAVAKVVKNTKLKEQLEFSQSSKSSQGEYSSSTSTSDESNLSGSSFGSRPHMSKDVRWEAIRHRRAMVRQTAQGNWPGQRAAC